MTRKIGDARSNAVLASQELHLQVRSVRETTRQAMLSRSERMARLNSSGRPKASETSMSAPFLDRVRTVQSMAEARSPK